MLFSHSLQKNKYPSQIYAKSHSGNHSVGSLTSGISDSHGVTGGVYKTRERIHRDILIRDY